MEVRMADHAVWSFIFFLTLFEMVAKTKMSVHGNSHAFMQANNEVRYLVDGIPVSMHKEFSGASGVRVPSLEENAIYNSKSHLKFEPPLLDFKERHLGMPHNEKVTLFNVNNNKTIHMSSISGNTVHFHSSFFENKIIPPRGNTTFNVVFLGREEGEIESSLFIHTSEGSFKYRVKGASVSSPYRLRPLVGVRIPLNATYSPLIFMHNPHATPMQIIEVYSSGGEFHLELPSGELEGPKHLWEIPPFHTKPVIRIRFYARAEKNHTAYVRIKVNKSEEVLVVPLEVEVTSQSGLYSLEDVIDFGIGGSRDAPRQFKLSLYNSWKKVIRIQNIATTPDSKAIKIDFQPIKVPPDSTSPTQIATLSFDWKAAYETKQLSGKLIIKSKQSQHKLVIPYVAHVLDGGLEFNVSVTQYCSDFGSHLRPRNFTVTNMFKIPVALINVSLPREADTYFTVRNFTPVVLNPGETVVLFRISVKKGSLPPDLKLESNLFLHTNVSTVLVPLLCYNGRLMRMIVSGLNETELNFGTVGSSSQKEAHFALINNNPVVVQLTSWGSNLTGAVVELVGVEEGNHSTILEKRNFNNMTTTLFIPPGHLALFRIMVTAPRTEGAFKAESYISTQFERISIPTTMRVAHGKLEILPEALILDDCFPGKLCVQPLHVRSLFSRSMAVTSITSVPPDLRVGYSYHGNGSLDTASITPLATSAIGELTFDPGLGCEGQCYLGITHNSTDGSHWIQSLGLPPQTHESDLLLLGARYDSYLSTVGETRSWHNLTLRLDSTEVRGHAFRARVRLVWPKLASSSHGVLAFPLTQIGNTTYRDLRLRNPSSKLLVLQLAMDWAYPEAEHVLDALPDSFRSQCVDCMNAPPEEFIVAESLWTSAGAQLGVSTHQHSLPLLLRPGETATARLGFSPNTPGLSSAMLFIRNNLTILEVVRLSGRAAHAQFKFGNRKPGSEAPLMFELADKHLKDCEREKHRKFPVPNLTVKRSFTARNNGELPIYVNGFSINGLPCEGYGFRILNCVPFQLPPNGTRKIDIAFTPDFTLARIQRTLSIDTSLGLLVNYTLITTLPPCFLAACSSVLGRPGWEPLLYYSAVSFMTFLLFCVLAAAFLESDRILKCAFLAMAKDKTMRVTTEPKPASPILQKNGESKTGTGKPEGLIDWNLNNSSVVQHHEKRSREAHHLTNTSSNNVYHKNNGWTQLEDKHLGTDFDMKERCSGIKYDETEGGYSTNSTTLLSMKSKKKLAKRNSNNSDASSVSENVQEISSSIKKGWSSLLSRSSNALSNQGGKSKLNLTENKISSSVRHTQEAEMSSNKKMLEISKEGKRLGQGIKKSKTHSEPVVCSEEETSSTTTESSNNEEIEKERDSLSSCSRDHKSVLKKDKGKSLDYRDNYEGDCDDDDYERDGHKKKEFSNRWKPSYKLVLGKTVPEVTTKVNNIENPKPASLELPYKLKSSKNSNRERKEKNVLKRRLSEKNGNVKGTAIVNGAGTSGSSARMSPPPRTASCWGESRASFSDVVARNDSPLYSNIVAPRKRPQPVPIASVFSEGSTRKTTDPTSPATSTGLGPIGPKKPTSSAWECFHETQKPQSQFLQKQQQQEQQTSLFMDALTEPSPSGQSADNINGLPYAGDSVWDQRGSVVPLLGDGSRKASDEFQRQHLFRENWPGVDSLWEPLYTPAVGDNTLFTPTVCEDAPSNPGSVWGSLMGSMWSSSTWSNTPGPVAPPISTPTASSLPTAAGDVPEEDAADIDRGLGFDPFSSLNTIWFSNTWNPPVTK